MIRKMFSKNLVLVLFFVIVVFFGWSGRAWGAELIINGGFETLTEGDVPAHWLVTPGTATLSSTTDPVHGGSYAASLTKTSTSGYSYIYQTIAVREGQSYTFSGYGYLPSAANISYLMLRINWQPGNTNSDSSHVTTTDSWVSMTKTAPAPSGTTQARVQCYAMIGSGGSTTPAYFDDVSFTGPASMVSAVADDNSGGGVGIQAGDRVVITFNSATNGYTITSTNIDTVLSLSGGHTWRDGNGNIGSAVWSSVNHTYDTLTITLSIGGGAPTVAPGDSITISAGTIQDSLGADVLGSPPSITGSFGVPVEVVINELMWMGSIESAGVGGSTDEWIELRNLTGSSVSLTGWYLTRLVSGAETRISPDLSGTLSANGYFLISRKTEADSKISVTPDQVIPGAILSDTALQIRLYDSNGNLRDTAGDGSAPLAGDKPKKYSMERRPAPGDGTVAGNWYTASAGVGWDAGATERGTPRSANSTPPAVGTSRDVLINEIAPSDSQDWIEIWNPHTTSKSIGSWRVLERSTYIKTFPDYTMSAGEYIVLHLGDDPDDPTDDEVDSDTNGNGYRDFYSTDSGLVGTDNVIIIEDPSGNIIDAVSFAKRDGSWATAQQTAFNRIVTASGWVGTPDGGAAINEAESANWTKGARGRSLGRDNASGVTDNNNEGDWYLITNQTPGRANPSSLASGVIIKINEVSFKAAGGRDWVELYCRDDGNSGNGVDISDCYFEDDGPIKIIARGTRIRTGEYLVLQPAAGCMTVTFIDVGEGDAILVQTPGGKRILIDGGTAYEGEYTLVSYLDRLGISTIHRIVATHVHSDHYAGLTHVLANKKVKEVWLCGSPVTGYDTAFTNAIANEGCPELTPSVGATYTWDEKYDVTATVLNNYNSRPAGGDANASSIVIHLKYGNVSFMLTGDAESSVLSGDARKGVEEALISSHGMGLTSDILKVGHHGSSSATSDSFLTYVYPDKAIISVGSNVHGHPHATCLSRLSVKGIPYYCTGSVSDQPTLASYGNIEIFTNGLSYWMDELSAGEDRIINIWAHSTALTSTDEQVILKDGLGNIEDAVCWSDGILPSAEQADLTAVYNAGEWSGDSASDCVDSTQVKTNYSIARDASSSDTNTKGDWSICSAPTRGKVNNADMPSGVGIRGLGVSEDPFLSDGSDLNRRYTKVSFSLNKESKLTAQVLDGRGRVVRTLGEDRYYVADNFSFKWDGKNNAGDPVPIGRYLIYIKAVAEDGDSSTEAMTTVTVAKSLSEGGGGGCFIATAAYLPVYPLTGRQGLDTLRQFRDQHLLTNPLGRASVSTYYRISPPIADFISDREPLKAIVRTYLKPIVWLTRRMVN